MQTKAGDDRIMTYVNVGIWGYVALVPRPSPLCIIVRILIVWGRETFEIGEGLSLVPRPQPEGKGSGRFRHISWDSLKLKV